MLQPQPRTFWSETYCNERQAACCVCRTLCYICQMATVLASGHMMSRCKLVPLGATEHPTPRSHRKRVCGAYTAPARVLQHMKPSYTLNSSKAMLAGQPCTAALLTTRYTNPTLPPHSKLSSSCRQSAHSNNAATAAHGQVSTGL